MAVTVPNSGFSRVHTGRERVLGVAPVRLVTLAVVTGLAVLALWSGAWLALGIVGGLFVLGSSLLAGSDEPLSARQAATLGAIHLAAGLLLAV
jgi:hypothetical protein